MSWSGSGFPTDEEFASIAKQTQKVPRRFWLPVGKSCTVVFLDDNPFTIYEHQLKIGGNFRNWYSCRLGFDEKDPSCPLCDAMRDRRIPNKRNYVGFLTIIDVTGWTGDRGEKIVNTRQLYSMGAETLKRMRVIKQKKTSLVGAMFEITRTGDRSPGCGDMWDFVKVVDPFKDEKFFYHSRIENKLIANDPCNYREMLSPVSSADMRKLVSSGYSSFESADENVESGADEDAVY